MVPTTVQFNFFLNAAIITIVLIVVIVLYASFFFFAQTIIRLKGVEKKYSSPHTVIKFFDDYRTLCQGLEKLGVGDGCVVPVANKFPPSHSASKLGFSMGEEALQQRCFLLNKWMGEVFRLYTTPGMPPAAQALFEQFLSLATNDDENSMTPDVMEHRAKILQM